MIKILGVIPSRYASTRFPGKPLIDIGGKSMIQRVYEQAMKCKSLTKVIVATDDERIAQHVLKFGGNVLMTSSDHQSGTDRCAEVLQKINEKFDAVVNIQGDEPFIEPEQIELIACCFEDDEVEIATLIKSTDKEEEILNPSEAKVVLDKNDFAIYFSRSPIPYSKNLNAVKYFKHIGIYGYRSNCLLQITKLKKGFLETAESLEQLRWIENGFRIKVKETFTETIPIDTPEDLERIHEFLKT